MVSMRAGAPGSRLARADVFGQNLRGSRFRRPVNLLGRVKMSASSVAAPAVLLTEVVAFAVERGVADYLPAVLDMTRRAFPNCPIRPIVEDDPEIPDWRAILMEVNVARLDVDELVAAQQQWSAGLFQHCPATHAHLFSLMTV
jgi:hypothetical protein